MENLKKLLNKLLYPHIAVLILLVISSAAALILAFAVIPELEAFAYCSYVLSAYTLTAVCFRVPIAVKWARGLKQNNKYVSRYSQDPQLRIKLSLTGTLVFNAIFSLFQLALGISTGSLWFYSLAGYYFLLAFMKLCLLSHTAKHKPGELLFREQLIYRMCGMGILLMTAALTVIIVYVATHSQATIKNEIVTIAMAAFSFTTLTVAIVNVVRYRKYNSPVFSASKAISFVSALVSMLTLEDSMLATFGGTDGEEFRRSMVGATGAGVSAMVIAIALFMIISSNKKIKVIKGQVEATDEHG